MQTVWKRFAGFGSCVDINNNLVIDKSRIKGYITAICKGDESGSSSELIQGSSEADAFGCLASSAVPQNLCQSASPLAWEIIGRCRPDQSQASAA